MSLENPNSFVLETRNLTKKFGAFEALADVSLKIKPGTIHAILGENGAGKTTLLKNLFGLHQPTSGDILLNGVSVQFQNPVEAIANGIGMVQQHFTLVEELSAIDNIILGAEPTRAGRLDRNQAIKNIEASLPSNFLAVPWFETVQNLNVGQKQKVEILKLLYRKSTVLFLDEPTAVLTPHEIQDFFQVLKKLKAQGCTIVIITHKLNEVFALCDELTVLRLGKTVGTREISKVSVEEVVELMIGRKPVPLPDTRSQVSTEIVLDVQNIFEKQRLRSSLKNVSLTLHKGEIVGIAGVEGSGQSQLVEILLGLRSFEGNLHFLNRPLAEQGTKELRSRIGLIPEDRLAQGLWPQENCFHNLIIGLEDNFSHANWISEAQIQKITPQWANQLDVRAASLNVSAGSLSGGNQQKIILARETRGKSAPFLICHHPTRGVDLGAIELIHLEFLRLRNEGKSLLVISSDLEELMALSDRIVVMFDGKTVKEFARGKYDSLQIGRYMTGAVQ